MTRFGWIVLLLIVLAVAGFVSMTRFGISDRHEAVQSVSVEPADQRAMLRVPVLGVPRSTITDTWGDARGGGTRVHHGTDIMAPAETPVVAVADGTIEKLFESERGGTTLYLRSTDGRWRYYYAHLAGYAAGVREGLPVRAGQRLGYVGDTGDAGARNYHLHFGVSRVLPGKGWWEGEEVNPYPLLASGRRPG